MAAAPAAPLHLTPTAEAVAPPPAEPLSGAVSIPSIDIDCAPMASGEWTGAGMRMCDQQGKVRSHIAEDGEVSDGRGATLAYIEGNGEVGDPQMQYAGKAHMSGQVVDHVETIVGEFDPGRGYIKDPHGSVIAELSKDGVLINNGGVTLGRFEGFSYDQLNVVAAYILLVDPGCIRGAGVFG